jgi:hypothetical protein
METIFIGCKKFQFIGHILNLDGFGEILLSIYQLQYTFFYFSRPAEARGGMDKAKYNIA